jgi:hypothetical protein
LLPSNLCERAPKYAAAVYTPHTAILVPGYHSLHLNCYISTRGTYLPALNSELCARETFHSSRFFSSSKANILPKYYMSYCIGFRYSMEFSNFNSGDSSTAQPSPMKIGLLGLYTRKVLRCPTTAVEEDIRPIFILYIGPVK